MFYLLSNFHIWNHFLTYLNNTYNSSDSPDFGNLTTTIVTWLNAFITPVSIIVGGLSLYKLMALGWKIAHTADRPDERKIAILSLVWWALGLILCIAAPLIINIVLPDLLNATDHSYDPPTTY